MILTICTEHQKLAEAMLKHCRLSKEDRQFITDMTYRLALTPPQAQKLAASARKHGFSNKRIKLACDRWINL